MTKSDWQTCTDPQAMLKWLDEQGKLSDRKARLFAVAACWALWPPIETKKTRKGRKPVVAVDLSTQMLAIAERYADGEASEEELRYAHNAYSSRAFESEEAKTWWGQDLLEFLNKALWWLNDEFPPAFDLARIAATSRNAKKAAHDVVHETIQSPRTEVTLLCGLLRDIFRYDTASFDYAWRTSEVIALATAIYDAKSFSRLRELADAVGKAGCRDIEMLDHLREPGLHVRGCWGLDTVLRLI